MAVWRALPDVPAHPPPSVVTLGVFDGVHRGHRVVLGAARRVADDRGTPLVVVTFDPHPMQVVRPAAAPLLLTTLERRLALLQAVGADDLLVLPFDAHRARQEPADFVAQVVVGTLRAAHVVVGSDFRFGHRAAGDVDLLVELGAVEGFDVTAVPLAGDHGRWSSTEVRVRLDAGDVAGAAGILGRPHAVEGVVVVGDHRGRELGYPTANLAAPVDRAVPADGVYAGWLVRASGARLPAAISVGTNPTFDGVQRRVEAYVLDRDDLELYGERVSVEFVERLRGQVRFDSVEDLVGQMRRDVDRCRDLLVTD